MKGDGRDDADYAFEMIVSEVLAKERGLLLQKRDFRPSSVLQAQV